MSKQLNVTRNELQKSYKNHYTLYKYGENTVSPKARRLLLFYAVECGLKSLILKNLGKNTYEELRMYSENNQLRIHGHDIKAMTREVGIDHIYSLKKIRLMNQGGNVSTERFNELWRYGVTVEDEEGEKNVEITLEDIAKWIGKRL